MKITKTHYVAAAVALGLLLVVAQTEFVDYFNGKKKLLN